MKTKNADAIQQLILDEAKRLDQMATQCAVSYARSDDQSDKASFVRHTYAAEEVRKLHGRVCQGLHALEAMIKAEDIHP